jgi:hypothetical protein
MSGYATSVMDVSKALMRLIRDNMFQGRELALIEPLNGPRPKTLYCSIGFVRGTPFQYPIKTWEKRNGDIYERILGTRYCQYRVTFFGDGSCRKAVDCQNWINSALGTQYILGPIAGFGKLGAIQEDITKYLGRQEERAFFNIELYANFSSEFKWMEVEHVAGDILRDGEESIPFNIDKP